MSSGPALDVLKDCELAEHKAVRRYLAELYVYLQGIVPESDVHRFLEETCGHLESLLEEYETPDDADVRFALEEFGEPRRLADDYIEAWYNKRSRLTFFERSFGPGNLLVLALFGMASLLFWTLLQFRVFLPSNSAFHLPWSPGEIRRYFPEPLPFPDFSLQFLLMTGVPVLAPPILGWIVGRVVPIKPAGAVYAVLMPIILVSFFIGVLLLPITDGLIFAIFQAVYWLPVGCGAAYLSARQLRRFRFRRARRIMSEGGS